jgi:hypothetical protein
MAYFFMCTNQTSSPDTKLETRSFPALAVTIELWAPDTQGPWSAQSMMHIYKTYKTLLNQKNFMQEKTQGQITTLEIAPNML